MLILCSDFLLFSLHCFVFVTIIVFVLVLILCPLVSANDRQSLCDSSDSHLRFTPHPPIKNYLSISAQENKYNAHGKLNAYVYVECFIRANFFFAGFVSGSSRSTPFCLNLLSCPEQAKRNAG